MRRTLSLFGLAALLSCLPSGGAAPETCGNGVIEPGELCDGPDVRGVTCAALGLLPGALRCSATCDRVETAGCGAPHGDDGGPAFDAGATADGGSGADAGASTDAGAPTDAGATPDAGPSMALRVTGARLEHADGRAVNVRGAISCCGGGYGWPLYDEAWVDLVSGHGATFLHMRLGPFLTQNPNSETDWAGTGGGYVEVNGKADLARFNESFWQRVRALIQYARDRGLYVEVDVLDTWGIKHCRWGDIPGYSPWDAAWNLQQADGCATGGSGAIAPGSLHEAWVKKVVLETGRFDNVLYQDGNEAGIVGGYAPAWSTSMAALIRAEETRLGYGRHLFGTNSGHATTIAHPSIDFVELHQDDAATLAQCGGKPCLVNEYNPRPSLTPAEFHERVCAARREGTWFWYWRHGQSAAEFQSSLSLLDEPCP